MEVVRLRCLADPSFIACTPLESRPPAYLYQTVKPEAPDDGSKQQNAAAHDAADSAPSLGALLRPNPANFAALRCDWTHPAVASLVMAQATPGVSLPGSRPPTLPLGPVQLPNLWNSMLPALTSLPHPGRYFQLQTLRTAAGEPWDGPPQPPQLQPVDLPQPNVLVGLQDDWLELSPSALPLWPTLALEPFAGPKPVQYFVLCPEELQSQALMFVKDVAAQYDLCNLGTNHPAAHVAWLYPFSAAHPPGSHAHPDSAAQGAWERLPAGMRYLAGLRGAAEQLQRTLLSSPLQLRQDGPALELSLGATPVIYLVCPFEEGSREQEEALLEAACCLGPCTPLGAGGDGSGSSSSGSGGSGGGAAAEATQSLRNGKHTKAPLGNSLLGQQGLGEPATPDPAAERHAGATPANAAGGGDGGPMGGVAMEVDGAGGAAECAGADGVVAAVEQARERYHGAAECLFRQQLGDCQQMAPREFPSGGAPPVDLVLQVVGPQCLSDLSGQLARATAFELYVKIRRRPQDPCALQPSEAAGLAKAASQQPAQQPPAHQQATGASPPVPFCSEPLLTLAGSHGAQPEGERGAPALQPEQEGGGMDMPDLLGSSPAPPGNVPSGSPQPTPRTLHCCYALPPKLAACMVARPRTGERVQGAVGARQRRAMLIPAAWTDSCGELLHCELVEVTLPGSKRRRSKPSGRRKEPSPKPGATAAVAAAAVAAVARRCCELLLALRSAAHPPGVLQDVVVARLGRAHAVEAAAWEDLLRDGGELLPVLGPSGQRVTVVGVEAAPPERLASASRPSGSGGGLLVLHGTPRPTASLALLPGEGPAMLTLPGEHDVVRMLQLELLASAGEASGGSGAACASSQDALAAAARELYPLSLLNAAHFGLLWGSCTAPGGPRAPLAAAGAGGPPAAAHLPLHAFVAGRMLSLAAVLCRRAGV